MIRKLLFITGTRADFGKLKTLIQRADEHDFFEVAVFITGMHTLKRYGYTVDEVYRALPEHRLRDGTRSVYVFHNQVQGEPMERVLANTIDGLSRYVTEFRPDLIVVHGDRIEALAGAVVGALRNILVAHIEGGEVSGTVDELIRHSVTKLSHIHFVANEQACRRLLQLGERPETVFEIGSPDMDLMLASNLPALSEVLQYYEIPFERYGLILFHPVTTDLEDTRRAVAALVDAVLASGRNFVVIYPNNDEGCELIFDAYRRFDGSARFKLIPSMRVEYFLTLLRSADFLLGNSSAGIRECPVFGVPAINVSSRQAGRGRAAGIIDVVGTSAAIADAFQKADTLRGELAPELHFGAGNSAELFVAALESDALWQVSTQKQFMDMN